MDDAADLDIVQPDSESERLRLEFEEDASKGFGKILLSSLDAEEMAEEKQEAANQNEAGTPPIRE